MSAILPLEGGLLLLLRMKCCFLRLQISDHRLNPINRNLIANGQDYSLVTLDLFVEFNALVAYGNRSSRDRGNPHWLPDGKYGWNWNWFTGLYREPKGTTVQNQKGPFTK